MEVSNYRLISLLSIQVSFSKARCVTLSMNILLIAKYFDAFFKLTTKLCSFKHEP